MKTVIRDEQYYKEKRDDYMVQLLLRYKGEEPNKYHDTCVKMINHNYRKETNTLQEPKLLDRIWYNINREIQIL